MHLVQTGRIRSTLALSAALAVAVTAVGPVVGAGAADSTAGKKDIVETAVGAGNFKTLASLLKQAGLVSTLSGDARYTVFAPTDAAFAKVPKATLQALGQDKAALRKVLRYHVVKGKLAAANVVKRTKITTVQGQSLPVRVSGSTVTVGGAKVTTANVTASNGVIHVINKVLIPR